MVYTKNTGRMQDENLVLCDTTAAITADALATVNGAAANGIINLGNARCAFDVSIPISALDVASNDEDYRVQIIGSTVAAMTSAGTLLGELHLGAFEVLDNTGTGVIDTDSVAGNHMLTCRNYSADGTIYPYVRLNWEVGGTSPSITPGGDVFIAAVRSA